MRLILNYLHGFQVKLENSHNIILKLKYNIENLKLHTSNKHCTQHINHTWLSELLNSSSERNYYIMICSAYIFTNHHCIAQIEIQ